MELNQSRKRILRVLAWVFAVMALVTVMPFKGATELSILGYRSMCPFAPISTFISLYLSFTIFRYLGNNNRKARIK